MLSGSQEVGVEIAHLVKAHFGFRVVAFCNSLDRRIDYAGTPAEQPEAIVLGDIAGQEDCQFVWQKKSDVGDECVMAAVTLGGRLLGRLGAVGPSISEPAWQTVANLAGITVERLRSQAVASRIEATRRSELLRGLLLDALAHDFETDLRHFTASTLTCAGVEDNVISLLTGHKSRELRRYQHLREDLKRRTVDLINRALHEAEKKASGQKVAATSRLLHAAPKKPQSVLPNNRK